MTPDEIAAAIVAENAPSDASADWRAALHISIFRAIAAALARAEKAEAERDEARKERLRWKLEVETAWRQAKQAREAALREAADLAKQFYEAKGSRIADAILALIDKPQAEPADKLREYFSTVTSGAAWDADPMKPQEGE